MVTPRRIACWPTPARVIHQPAGGGPGKQDIQLATIPLFQFAIFYNMYLDINPGDTMVNPRAGAFQLPNLDRTERQRDFLWPRHFGGSQHQRPGNPKDPLMSTPFPERSHTTAPKVTNVSTLTMPSAQITTLCSVSAGPGQFRLPAKTTNQPWASNVL